MKAIYDVLTAPHYLAGFVALVSFWAPLLVQRGGVAHKRAGNVFFWSMIVVSATSLVMAALSFMDPAGVHPTREVAASRTISLFLAYLGVVSVAVVVNGRSATRLRARPEALAGLHFKALNLACLLGSVLMLVLGVAWEAVLLMAMSPIGVLVANGYRKHLKAVSSRPALWRAEHASTMIVGGICVHTAFIAGGGTRFLPAFIGELGWWVWLVPTAIGVPLSIVARRRHAPRAAGVAAE